MKTEIVLFSNTVGGWYEPYLKTLAEEVKYLGYSVKIARSIQDLNKIQSPQAICFILASTILIPAKTLSLFEYNIIIHESDLPLGKGWSPLSYQIEEGKDDIVFTAFNASSDIDAGDIIMKKTLHLDGTELLDELKRKQAELTKRIVVEIVLSYPNWELKPQSGPSSYYPKRSNDSNKLNPSHRLDEIFSKLRVADNDNFPAWFEIKGKRYSLKIEELSNES